MKSVPSTTTPRIPVTAPLNIVFTRFPSEFPSVALRRLAPSVFRWVSAALLHGDDRRDSIVLVGLVDLAANAVDRVAIRFMPSLLCRLRSRYLLAVRSLRKVPARVNRIPTDLLCRRQIRVGGRPIPVRRRPSWKKGDVAQVLDAERDGAKSRSPATVPIRPYWDSSD